MWPFSLITINDNLIDFLNKIYEDQLANNLWDFDNNIIKIC